MKDRVFKIAMAHLENSFIKSSASKEEIKHIKRLIDIIKGDVKEEGLPEINNTEDLHETAKTLGLSKNDLHRIVMDILKSMDTRNLPTGLVGDIGEFLGDKKGIGLIPTSLLNRAFLKEELDKKMGSNKWEFFFQDDGKLKKFKEQKGFK